MIGIHCQYNVVIISDQVFYPRLKIKEKLPVRLSHCFLFVHVMQMSENPMLLVKIRCIPCVVSSIVC
jgi:hypothetical protein